MTFIAIGSLTLQGCASSEETEGGDYQGQPLSQEQPKSQDDQALSSFVGDKQPEQKPAAPVQQPPPQTQPESTPAAIPSSDIDQCRNENARLQQSVTALQEEMQTMRTRMQDLESQVTNERTRADQAEQRAEAEKTRADNAARSSTGTPAVPSVAAQPSTNNAARAPSEPQNTTEYDNALNAFKGRKYDDAITQYERILESGAKDDVAKRCHYWIGEALFAKKQYQEAAKRFEKALALKGADKKADAQYMLAQCYDRLGDKVKAKEAYEKLAKDFPTSAKRKLALERAAKL
jgi:TolA-binding protein